MGDVIAQSMYERVATAYYVFDQSYQSLLEQKSRILVVISHTRIRKRGGFV